MPDTWISLHEAVSAFKRRFILDVLAHFDGNRSRTAAALRAHFLAPAPTRSQYRPCAAILSETDRPHRRAITNS
jgi:hypothetical protein